MKRKIRFLIIASLERTLKMRCSRTLLKIFLSIYRNLRDIEVGLIRNLWAYGPKKLGGGGEQFCPTQTEIARLHLSKNLHLMCMRISREYYLFVHYKIRIIHLKPISLIQLPDLRVKIAQLSLFLNKFWGEGLKRCTTSDVTLRNELRRVAISCRLRDIGKISKRFSTRHFQSSFQRRKQFSA